MPNNAPDGPRKKRVKSSVGFRVSEDYGKWLTAFAESRGSKAASVSNLIDQALAYYAKRVGFRLPPPR
jgi:hypothetical protein